MPASCAARKATASPGWCSCCAPSVSLPSKAPTASTSMPALACVRRAFLPRTTIASPWPPPSWHCPPTARAASTPSTACAPPIPISPPISPVSPTPDPGLRGSPLRACALLPHVGTSLRERWGTEMERRHGQDEPRVFEDHRDNLTVDVQNVLMQERASQLRSEDSQVALLWNVFRSLQNLDPRLWLPRLVLQALGAKKSNPRLRGLLAPSQLVEPIFHWWQRYDLPPSRHEWHRDRTTHGNLDLGHYPACYVPEKKAEATRLLQEGLFLEDRVEIPLV